MLLLPNKKKMASVILAGMGKPKAPFVQGLGEEPKTGSYELPEGDEDPAASGLEASMDAFIQAVSAKDAKGACQAMKDFMAQYDGKSDVEPDGDEA